MRGVPSGSDEKYLKLNSINCDDAATFFSSCNILHCQADNFVTTFKQDSTGKLYL